MSYDFWPVQQTKSFKEFREATNKGEVKGLKEGEYEKHYEDSFPITDGESFAWCYEEGPGITFTRYGNQVNINKIMELIEEYLQLELTDEHEEDEE